MTTLWFEMKNSLFKIDNWPWYTHGYTFLNIPFQVYSSLCCYKKKRLCSGKTRFWSVAVGDLCSFSPRSIYKLRQWCWWESLRLILWASSSQRCSVGSRSRLCAGRLSFCILVLAHHGLLALILLCAQGRVILKQVLCLSHPMVHLRNEKTEKKKLSENIWAI